MLNEIEMLEFHIHFSDPPVPYMNYEKFFVNRLEFKYTDWQ